MVWVDQYNLGLSPLLALDPPLSPLTHHRDNVTAPHGRPNLRSRLHSCHAQERREDHEVHKGHVVGGKPHSIEFNTYIARFTCVV